MPQRTISRRPIAASRSRTTRTRIRATRPRRSASRRPPRPTRCSATTRSARPTTSSASPGVEGMGGAGSAQDFSSRIQGLRGHIRRLRRLLATSSTRSSAALAARRRGRGGERVSRGANLRYDLELSFEQAVFGAAVEIAYTKNDSCKTCHGSGSADGAGKRVCPTCQGSGQVQAELRLLLDSADLPELPRRGLGHREALPRLRRLRPQPRRSRRSR